MISDVIKDFAFIMSAIIGFYFAKISLKINKQERINLKSHCPVVTSSQSPDFFMMYVYLEELMFLNNVNFVPTVTQV